MNETIDIDSNSNFQIQLFVFLQFFFQTNIYYKLTMCRKTICDIFVVFYIKVSIKNQYFRG